MSKVLNQQTPYRSNHKKGSVVAGKIADPHTYDFFATQVNSQLKEPLADQAPSTSYKVVKINQDLATRAEQKKPTAKAEETKAMFEKYRASK